MLVLMLLLGCPKGGSPTETRLDAAVERVDAAWRARATHGLKPVHGALYGALAMDPHAPALLWRKVRLEHSAALMARTEGARLEHLADGRALASACVLGDARVAALRSEVGLSDALREVRGARRTCLAWGALAWARWLLHFGPEAGAMDATTLELHVEALEEMGSDPEVTAWAKAVLRAGQGDLVTSRRLLNELARDPADPTGGVALADLYQYVDRGTPLEAQTLDRLNEKRPASLEARALLQRLLASP